MKKIYTTALLLATVIFCNAQSWELKVNAGGNTTFVSGIWGHGTYGDFTPIVPGLYNIGNSKNPPSVGIFLTDNVSEYNMIGFYSDVELKRLLSNNWSFSVSVGINKTNFTYDVGINSRISPIDSIKMKDIDGDFGDTKLLHISSRFLNVTKSFSNLSLSAGPVFNFLVHDNGRGKIYYHDNGDNTVNYITSPLYKPNKILYGGNLAISYKLAQSLELKAGTQYFFNSVYKNGENKDNDGKDVKVNPFQINLGLSYSIMKF